jgi:hypothetical protein
MRCGSVKRLAVPQQDATRENWQAFTVAQDDLAIDHDPANTQWIEMRALIRGLISDLLRIKDDQVGLILRTDKTSICQA